ncbi:hypothetical protein A4X13_0g5071, partial [Tilletia indica]
MYDDMAGSSIWRTTTPLFPPVAYDDAQAAERRNVDPSSGRTEMEPLSPIMEVSAEGSASAVSEAGSRLDYDMTAPQAEMSWYAPLRPMTSLAQNSEDLIDLSADATNPFTGFRPAPPRRAEQSSTTPEQNPSVRHARQSTPLPTEDLKFLVGAGFRIEDPALTSVLQDPGAVSALA